MNISRRMVVAVFITFMGAHNYAQASGAGTVAGLSLIEPSGARAAALGEAFSAVNNDITAFGYNPASLGSLDSGQASFMYKKGLADDSFGQFLIGSPSRLGHFGLSVGYYNAGTLDLTDANLNTRTVNAQKDMTISMGYSNKLGDNLNWGMAAKYISSKLVDTYNAVGYAADFGMQMSLTSRVGIGAAVQNLGTKMTYLNEGDSLPVIARMGASILMIPGSYATTMLLDMPYYATEKELRPAVGLEVKVGPMAIRSGYRKTNGLNSEFTIGAGFLMGSSAIDYSFGMVDQLNSEHRISLSMKFGTTAGSLANTPIVRKPTVEKYASHPREVQEVQKTAEKPEVTFVQRQSLASLDSKGFEPRGHQVYQVRPGDTLGKIAQRMYGDARDWKKIYAANRHLLDDTKALEVGQKIVLP